MTELRKSETPPVWLYWEGRKPPIVSLCIKTIRRYNPSARVLDYKAAAELGAAPVLKPFRRLPLCFQSNILRIWLTWKFGGIFIDADSICMSPIELVWMCYSYDFVGVTSPNWPARETVIGGRAGSPLLEQTFVRYQEVLRKFYDNKPND